MKICQQSCMSSRGHHILHLHGTSPFPPASFQCAPFVLAFAPSMWLPSFPYNSRTLNNVNVFFNFFNQPVNFVELLTVGHSHVSFVPSLSFSPCFFPRVYVCVCVCVFLSIFLRFWFSLYLLFNMYCLSLYGLLSSLLSFLFDANLFSLFACCF